MNQLKTLTILWVLFFTFGNAHAVIVTDTVSGTVSQFLDATDYAGNPSIPPFITDLQGNVVDARVVSGITVIDLFKITYDTDLKKPVGTSGIFLIDQLVSLEWSSAMQNLFFVPEANPVPYGGGILPWISAQGPGPFVVLNSAEQATRFQFSDEVNGVETTIWTSWAEGSAVTMHSPLEHKTSLKFSDINVVSSPVPVPGALLLFGSGLLGLLGVGNWRRR